MFVRSAKRETERASKGTERKKKFFTFSFMAIKINPQTKKQTTKRERKKEINKLESHFLLIEPLMSIFVVVQTAN